MRVPPTEPLSSEVGRAVELAEQGRDTLLVVPGGPEGGALAALALRSLRPPALVVGPAGADSADLAPGVSLATPEQLTSGLRPLAPPIRRPRLVLIQDANRISDRRPDFRPAYLGLREVFEQLGRPGVLAIAAAASPQMRAEIAQRLGMWQPVTIAAGFDRPAVWLGVSRFERARDKLAAVLAGAAAADKPGVIYAGSRRGTERIAGALRGQGFLADAFHRGLRRRERARVRDAFAAGRIEVIVVTTGSPAPVGATPIHFVFHHDVPPSIDGYYQDLEVAGRDGWPARAVLFFRPGEVGRAGLRLGLTERLAERSQALMMPAYAELRDCRRRYLLRYFGGDAAERCGRCDNCDADRARWGGLGIRPGLPLPQPGT